MEKKLAKENKCDHRGTSEQTNKQQTGKNRATQPMDARKLGQTFRQSPLPVQGASCNYLLIIYFEIQIMTSEGKSDSSVNVRSFFFLMNRYRIKLIYAFLQSVFVSIQCCVIDHDLFNVPPLRRAFKSQDVWRHLSPYR